ncbi:MAG: outer membrane lipoprotein-sorting protein [Candidatus Marinimicrobia bacterium]|nr:outer membrane lipoprotein-sorting protein [Candidatus Neomarinimicrobiota bacterium]
MIRFPIIKLFCLLLTTMAAGYTQTGEELLNDLLGHMNPESSRGIMRQTIHTLSGEKRVLTYESAADEKGKNSMMRYLSPARVKGNALLMKNYSNDIWMYNNRTKRVRKLASHAKKQKFEGSDFTYEDMGSGDTWRTDYAPVPLGIQSMDGIKCNVLELKSENEANSYSKILAFLRTEDQFPLKIEYYDNSGNLEKTLFLDNIEKIQGVSTAMKMVMENRQDNTSTIMEYESVEYNVTFDKNFFSEQTLKR